MNITNILFTQIQQAYYIRSTQCFSFEAPTGLALLSIFNIISSERVPAVGVSVLSFDLS